jgi:putative peptide zinc metalloprotease protein
VQFQEPATILAVVPEDSADLVRQRTTDLEVRFVGAPRTPQVAHIAREVPALTTSLPNRALSTMGGGQIVLDPTDARREKSLANLLHLELRLADRSMLNRIGERAHVRFSHGYEPLAGRLYRGWRQLFLKHFKV